MLLLKFHKYLRDVASLMNSLSVLAHAFIFAFFKEYLLQLFMLKILETIFIKEKKKKKTNIPPFPKYFACGNLSPCA